MKIHKIKIFMDGADETSILNLSQDPSVKGLTTNPSLIKEAGVKNYTAFCKKLLEKIKDKPISFEVFSDELEGMASQAKKIKNWGENVYVKIPITNSKGESTLPLIKELSGDGVKLNITALFTMEQILPTILALKDGAPSIVSVFAGRIADAGVDPEPIMSAAAKICRSLDSTVELLWASTREPFNIIQAERAGCHIITVPPTLLKKLIHFGKDLTQYSLETVLKFKEDAEKAGYSIET